MSTAQYLLYKIKSLYILKIGFVIKFFDKVYISILKPAKLFEFLVYLCQTSLFIN